MLISEVVKRDAIGNFMQSRSPFLVFFFCADKKRYLIRAFKYCHDPCFNALIIRLFLNLG